MITDQEKQQMWEEIKRSIEDERKLPIRPDERTKEQLKELFGVGNSQINTLIKKLLKNGKITHRLAISNNKVCNAYSIVLEEVTGDNP